MTDAVTKIIAIDDDPTGSQTVHGCLLLTRWDVETLLEGLRDASPLFFVLSNTRGMDAESAARITREICVNLRTALTRMDESGAPIQPLLLSRSDSTLRGHYPVETDVIAEELGPFDAHFLVPAFFEGGRVTRDGIHYLIVDGEPVPVHETEFARDSVFGFSTAFLPDYVQEKTSGRISAAEVERFSLADVRGDLTDRLMNLDGNRCCVVDAEQQSDLDGFARQLVAAAGQGKRFLFRSAASLLTALAALPPQPVPAAEMATFVRGGRPGVVLMGSHVGKSTRQLQHLLAETDAVGLEIDLDHLDETDGPYPLVADLIASVEAALQQGRGAVLYTSRGERQFATKAERLAFGDQVADLLVRIGQQLPADIGFLISKGGITSNDTLSKALALRTARVLGQVHAGCSVVRCPEDHPRFPNLPVVIFPGNVGGDETLTEVYQTLTTRAAA
ncbi:Hrp-dependent type III effector protein [Lamprobacter modestohalophilus]|uniref:Hrp-dependent type III effector protein n=1 Tax=Lamprobacter modestohalophilus TaxID=1064514 RepID=A0A9X0WBD6_9GAMM|nr:four-carbon acid sugar kinase family protein [Lamprobacter modestohalophilus]MBK1620562.1 Hrp-dependent type III effector protein [Lamprobacter modestohalophilus]